MIKKIIICTLLVFIFFIKPSISQEKFLSLKKSKVNVRHGPNLDSPIKYIYKKVNLPVKQIDKKENFRRIIDLKNNSGWIHVSQLKKSNSVITTKDKVLFKKPTSFAKPIALLKKGRLLILEKCYDKWCFTKTGTYQGWVDKLHLWGNIN